MKWQVRILIADDHEIVRRGLQPLIEAERALPTALDEALTPHPACFSTS